MIPIRARDKSLQSIRLNKMELNFVNKFIKESGENKQNFLEKKFLEVEYLQIYFRETTDFFKSENFETINNILRLLHLSAKKSIENNLLEDDKIKLLKLEFTNEYLKIIIQIKEMFKSIIVADENINFKFPKKSNSTRKYSLGFRIEEEHKDKWGKLKEATRLSKREILLRMIQDSKLRTVKPEISKPINELQMNIGKGSGNVRILIPYVRKNPEIFCEEDVENLEKIYKELRETKQAIVDFVKSKKKEGRIFM